MYKQHKNKIKKQRLLFVILILISSCISKDDFFGENVKYTGIIGGAISDDLEVSDSSINIRGEFYLDLTHAKRRKDTLYINDSISIEKASDIYLLKPKGYVYSLLLIPKSKINEVGQRPSLKGFSKKQFVSMIDSYFDYIYVNKIEPKYYYDTPMLHISPYLYFNGFSPIFEQTDYYDLVRKYKQTGDSIIHTRIKDLE